MIEKLIYDVITKFLMEGCLTTYIVIIGYLAPLLLTAEISKSKKAHQFLVVYWIVLLISEQFFLKVNHVRNLIPLGIWWDAEGHSLLELGADIQSYLNIQTSSQQIQSMQRIEQDSSKLEPPKRRLALLIKMQRFLQHLH